ncbi:HesA/MoeB/ThiF family protein [Paracoccus sediminicola]|uniref:HesA/MoeB/ThiF family protein n=1 Tax=Paracoccus sediminicola TaxID=3017783 RepID=UPI0022F0B562|nr:HesA/MoeB/ThiF family protein [Paracoccus sediminicola]WBU55476.1 HesA/MoeB/ThiF family protein [Paracoccus sediminicola]
MALLLPLGLLSVAAVAWIMGWGVLRVLLLLVVMWIAILGLMLAAPAAEYRSFSGFDVQSWLVTGLVLALVLGYAAIIRRLRGAARARWGAENAPGAVAPRQTSDKIHSGARQADALDRYARHYVLREIGGPGQGRLRDSSVLIVGAGGLGSPAALYLAAAGVGRLCIADPDEVSLSNLQRQILFRTADTGRPKGMAAAEALRALNPYIDIHAISQRIGAGDAELIAGFDLVLDGCDSFADRARINALCARAGVPLIAGSISQWEGQLSLYDPAGGGPCMACIFPDPPAPGLAPSCAEAGVVGPLPGVIGSMMALEAIKEIAGAGTGLRSQMVIFDGLHGETRRISLRRRADCPVCSGVAERGHEA